MDIKRNTIWIITGIVLIILKDTQTHEQNLDNYIEEDKYIPNFITLGQKYRIAVGSTVVLPCKLNETEHSTRYVLAWKRDNAVLTAGNIKVTSNSRIKLLDPDEIESNEPHSSNYNLEIHEVRLSDAGEYACQIGSIEPVEIIHILEVLIPAKIHTVKPSNRVDISKGGSIRLECDATGNPPPKIVWSRKNNVMPNGESNVTTNVLEMMHADRHTVGHYRCTADNGVGQPDTREFFVNVLYAPEIEVERPFVHTGVGFEAQLICIVHAEPLPHVIWYKDTTQLGTTEQHSQQNRGNRYSLIIRNVTHNDLGNYTCQAANNLGKDRASLTLSGIPTVCTFDSPTLSNYRDQYNISWWVQSYSPILEYRLYYRKQGDPRNHNDHDKIGNHLGVHHYDPGRYVYTRKNSGSMPSYGTAGGNYMHYGNTGHGGDAGGLGPVVGSGIHHGHEQWENILIPKMHSSSHRLPHNHMQYGFYNGGGHRSGIDYGGGAYIDHNHLTGHKGGFAGTEGFFGVGHNHNTKHRMSFQIRHLTPASNYEARVQARNDHGWNKMSSVFHFSTLAEHIELEPSAQPAVSKTAGVLDKDAYTSSGNSFIRHNQNIQPLSLLNSQLNNALLIFLIFCHLFLS